MVAFSHVESRISNRQNDYGEIARTRRARVRPFGFAGAPLHPTATAPSIASGAKHPYPLVTGHYSVHTNEEALLRGEAGYAKIAETMKLVPGQPIDRPGAR